MMRKLRNLLKMMAMRRCDDGEHDDGCENKYDGDDDDADDDDDDN